MTRFLAALLFLLFVVPASAQTCPTRPAGDNTNACASTAFVHQATGGAVPITVPNGGTGQTSFTANLPLIGNGTGAIGQGTRQGNTTSFAMTTGTFTAGHCRTTDASGNEIDAGFACNSGTGSGTVNAGTANQLAFYPSSGAAVSGTFSPNLPFSTFWYQNNGAYVQRFNDRMLISGATVGDANTPNTTQDWLTAYQVSFGVAPSCPVADLCVLNYTNGVAGAGAGGETIVAGVRSGYITQAGPTPLAMTAIGVNDSEPWSGTGTISGTTFTVSTTTSGAVAIGQFLGITGIATPVQITGGTGPNWTLASAPGNIGSPAAAVTAWQNLVEGYYGEAHRLNLAEGQTNAAEFEIRNKGNEVLVTPFQLQAAPFNSQLSQGLVLGCGAGESSTGQSPCSNALVIAQNGSGGTVPFDTGIIFGSSSIKGQSDGTTRALSLPGNYQAVWFNSSNTVVGTIGVTTGGVLALTASTGLSINGALGVNCSGAPTASFNVAHGIVTQC